MSNAVARAAKRWYWQRMTAMAMALFVVVHVLVMIYAIDGGLSAAEVLERTRHSVGWALFYGIFVVLVSIHASIGVRNVLIEWTGVGERRSVLLSNLLGLVLLVMGLRAVWAVTVGGAA